LLAKKKGLNGGIDFMATIVVRDSINANAQEPSFSWKWDGAEHCTAGMIIEERIRFEFDRARSGGAKSALFQELSVDLDNMADRIVERGLRAFRQQKILLIVNDHQVTTLDERINLGDVSEAVFLKLVPLAGG
jgi:hypothetical protein